MMSNKLIVGMVLVIAVLVAFYVGNLVMKTTPSSRAGTTYQYKVVPLSGEDGAKAAFVGTPYATAEANAALEEILNDAAQGGWEYVAPLGAGASFLFRK